MKKLFLMMISALSLSGYAQISVKINDSITYQQIFGFGAYGGYGQNNDAFITKVITDLGLTINRGDFNFPTDAQFDSEKKTYIQNMKAKATANNEPLEFFFSVWTPTPAWKANNSVCDNTCSSLCNAQTDKKPTCDGTTNYLLPEHYADFATGAATFFKRVKTVTGVEPFAFSIQNEPAYNEPYVSCKYTPAQYNTLLKTTKEEFVKQGLTTKFLGPEDMGSASMLANWTNVIFNDPVTVNYLDIVAVHGYLDGVSAATGDATGWANMYSSVSSKKKMFFMSETSGYLGQWLGNTTYPGSFDLAKAIFNALRYGKLNAWVWWSLNDNQSPPANEHYAILYNGNPTKNYYVSKSYYRYIRPGAVQIECTSPDKDVMVTAFKNPGSATYTAVKPQFTVILINNSTSTKTISLSGKGLPSTLKAYRTSSSENCAAIADATPSSISLPAQTITTLVYESTNKAPTISQPNDVTIVKNNTVTVNLTGVTAGAGETQTLAVSAISSNKALVPGAITVTGTAPNYSLSFTPASNVTGTTTITVFVKDNGSTDLMNTTVIKFNVKVIPFINHAPTINQVVDVTCGMNNSSKKHYISLTGIADGDDGTQTINKPALTFSDASKVRLPYANYTSPATTGSMEFYPNAIGSTTVTLKLQDAGGTDLGGNDTKTITFNINVVADAPYVNQGMAIPSDELMSIYPNPASESITVKLPDEDFSSITIVDITGKIKVERQIISSETSLNVSDLGDGVYIVIARGQNRSMQSKFVISR